VANYGPAPKPRLAGARRPEQIFTQREEVEISSIFNWFRQDFEKAGGIRKILDRYAPSSVRDFAGGGNTTSNIFPIIGA
jgi:hypothetical protein